MLLVIKPLANIILQPYVFKSYFTSLVLYRKLIWSDPY